MQIENMFYRLPLENKETIEQVRVMKRAQSTSKIMLGVALAAASILGGLEGHRVAAAQPSNPYPYGLSTYWAWQNRPDLPPTLGTAKDWDQNARNAGFPVTGYPRKGDVAVFEAGVLGAAQETGRVSVVEQVFDNGTYSASEMQDAECLSNSQTCGTVHRQTYPIAPGTSFIHYKTDTRTTWGFGSGAAGWTTRDLGEGNMGGPGWFYPITGDHPQLTSPGLDIPLSGYNAVEVTMVTGMPVADPAIKVYFATASQQTFAPSMSVTLEGQADGVVHTYRAYFGTNPFWSGNLSGLRIEPAGPGGKGGVRIDRVALVQVDPGDATFMAMTEGDPSTTGARSGGYPYAKH